MQKKVIVEKMRVQSQRLKQLLTDFSSLENHSVSEIETILKETEQLARVLSAYRFLSEHKEISNDLNVHLKIMDVVSKQEEAKVEVKEQVKPLEPVNPAPVADKKKEIPEEKNPVAIPVVTDINDQEKETPKSNTLFKKIEFGLNDKYRIINELFNHNAAEFTTAVDQLNMTHSWEDAENYLDSLRLLYNWKPELPLVKTLYAISQKRFN